MKNKNKILNGDLPERRLIFLEAKDSITSVVTERLDKDKDKDEVDSLRQKYEKGELTGDALKDVVKEVAQDLIKESKAEGVRKAEILHETLKKFVEELQISEFDMTDIKVAYDTFEKEVGDAKDLFDERMQDYQQRGYAHDLSPVDHGVQFLNLDLDDEIAEADKSSDIGKARDSYIKSSEEYFNLKDQLKKMTSLEKAFNAKDLNKQIKEKVKKMRQSRKALNEAIKSEKETAYSKGADTIGDKLVTAYDKAMQTKKLDKLRSESLDRLNGLYTDLLPGDFTLPTAVNREGAVKIDELINSLSIKQDSSIDGIKSKFHNLDDLKPLTDIRSLKVAVKDSDSISIDNDAFPAVKDAINNYIYLREARKYRKEYGDILVMQLPQVKEAEKVAVKESNDMKNSSTTEDTTNSKKDTTPSTGTDVAARSSNTTEATSSVEKEAAVIEKKSLPSINFKDLSQENTMKAYKANGDIIEKAFNLKVDKLGTSEQISSFNKDLTRGQKGIQDIQLALNKALKAGKQEELVPDGLAGPKTIAALQWLFQQSKKRSSVSRLV